MEETQTPEKKDTLLIIIKLAYLSLLFIGTGIYDIYIIRFLIKFPKQIYALSIMDISLLIGATLIFICTGVVGYLTITNQKSKALKIFSRVIYGIIIVGLIILILGIITLFLYGPG